MRGIDKAHQRGREPETADIEALALAPLGEQLPSVPGSIDQKKPNCWSLYQVIERERLAPRSARKAPFL